MLISLSCTHKNNVSHSIAPIVTIYPNFVVIDNEQIYSHESLHFGRYVYVGGDVAVERSLIEKYTAEIIHHGVSMHGLVNGLNQEAVNERRSQISPINAHIFSGVIYRYLFIQMILSMGE